MALVRAQGRSEDQNRIKQSNLVLRSEQGELPWSPGQEESSMALAPKET